MKRLLPILFCVLLAMACSDDFTDIGSRPSAVSAEGEAYRVVRKARSYFKQNEKRLPFMQDRALRFTDFRYGLSRRFVNEDGFYIEIPVIRGLITSNRRADWVRGQKSRVAVRVQFDGRENITKINYVWLEPTEDYYAAHTDSVYYNHFVGKEDVYSKENVLLGVFRHRSPLTRTTWEPDSNGIYPGDSIPEVIIPGHQGGDGEILFPDNPGGAEADTTAVEDVCKTCLAALEYDSETGTYYCPRCDKGDDLGVGVGGGGGTHGGGSGNSGSTTTTPQPNPNLKTNFKVKGYLPGYKSYEKINQLPNGARIRLYNPETSFDKSLTMIKRTPEMVIGQSRTGCVVADINHLLLAFGGRVTGEDAVWDTYWRIADFPSTVKKEEVMDNGVYASDLDMLLTQYFDIAAIENSLQIVETLERGNPIFVNYLKEESAETFQSHAQVIYGYGQNGRALVLFDSSLQDDVVWDANDLNNRISYIYEIKGRK